MDVKANEGTDEMAWQSLLVDRDRGGQHNAFPSFERLKDKKT